MGSIFTWYYFIKYTVLTFQSMNKSYVVTIQMRLSNSIDFQYLRTRESSSVFFARLEVKVRNLSPLLIRLRYNVVTASSP